MTRLDRHLGPDAMRTALEADVRAGLTASPKTLPPKWFYDARGSQLFDEITRLPEYYPTRRERAVLEERSAEIAAVTGADTLVELGSGTSEKTRLLLDALRDAGTLTRFVPFDVDESVLTMASKQVEEEYPGVEVHAVVGDFEHHLPLLPTGGRRLVAFLGGTVGNLLPVQRASFLAALAADVRAGLAARPRSLPPKWFYDERGSQLFDEITRLPEYYPTECERALLREHAAEAAALTAADTLVELGSGTSDKTRLLLDALRDAGTLQRFVPFDVDESVLRSAGAAIARDYPGVAVHAVCGDFERHLPLLPGGGRRLVAFLGGTIGNLLPPERARFLADLRDGLQAGDALLLGTDLVKDPDRLVRAYDDAAGVTAQFNRNVLHVLVRELGADLDPDGFVHVALWDAEAEWVEMRLRARSPQVVRVLDLEVSFDEGEELRTEVSAKFTRERVERELDTAGLRLARWWTDGDYALSLALPA